MWSVHRVVANLPRGLTPEESARAARRTFGQRRDGDIEFSRTEIKPGTFRIRATRGGRTVEREFVCFHATHFGIDFEDLAEMEKVLDDMIAELRLDA